MIHRILEHRLSNVHGYAFNLRHPRSLNEKIRWVMLHCNLEPLAVYVDKVSVRDFVAERIGREYLLPLYGVYERFEDIDFDALPSSFVLKVSHGCAMNVFVRDKASLDVDELRPRINRWLATDF